MQELEFTSGDIKPVECAREAWELIKDDYWILFAISLVGALIGGVSMYVLIGSMVCGIFHCYLKKIDGGKVALDDLWVGFKFFWPSLLVTIAILLPAVVLFIVMFVTIYLPIITAAIMGDKVNQGTILGTFLVGFAVDIVLTIVMVCFHSLLIFCFPLIVDRGLSSWDSMKLSGRAVLKNLGGIGGLIALNFLFAFIGELAFCIGLYLAIPIITAMNLVAYRKVFPKATPSFLHPPAPGLYDGIA